METMELTKTEKNSLNKLLDNIIKRILKTPQGTPRESLYIESNLLDIETIIEKKRIGMMYRIHQHPNTITEEITKPTSKWMINTQEITKKYNIDKDYLLNLTKRKAKKLIRKSVHKTFRKKIMANMENKTKIDYLLKHYTPGEKTNYTNNLNRQEVSTLFKTRTRMIDIKGNYKNKYPDQTCRLCKNNNETQEHVLEECRISVEKNLKTTMYNLSARSSTIQRKTIRKIQEIIELLKNTQ